MDYRLATLIAELVMYGPAHGFTFPENFYAEGKPSLKYVVENLSDQDTSEYRNISINSIEDIVSTEIQKRNGGELIKIIKDINERNTFVINSFIINYNSLLTLVLGQRLTSLIFKISDIYDAQARKDLTDTEVNDDVNNSIRKMNTETYTDRYRQQHRNKLMSYIRNYPYLADKIVDVLFGEDELRHMLTIDIDKRTEYLMQLMFTQKAKDTEATIARINKSIKQTVTTDAEKVVENMNNMHKETPTTVGIAGGILSKIANGSSDGFEHNPDGLIVALQEMTLESIMKERSPEDYLREPNKMTDKYKETQTPFIQFTGVQHLLGAPYPHQSDAESEIKALESILQEASNVTIVQPHVYNKALAFVHRSPYQAQIYYTACPKSDNWPKSEFARGEQIKEYIARRISLIHHEAKVDIVAASVDRVYGNPITLLVESSLGKTKDPLATLDNLTSEWFANNPILTSLALTQESLKGSLQNAKYQILPKQYLAQFAKDFNGVKQQLPELFNEDGTLDILEITKRANSVPETKLVCDNPNCHNCNPGLSLEPTSSDGKIKFLGYFSPTKTLKDKIRGLVETQVINLQKEKIDTSLPVTQSKPLSEEDINKLVDDIKSITKTITERVSQQPNSGNFLDVLNSHNEWLLKINLELEKMREPKEPELPKYKLENIEQTFSVGNRTIKCVYSNGLLSIKYVPTKLPSEWTEADHYNAIAGIDFNRITEALIDATGAYAVLSQIHNCFKTDHPAQKIIDLVKLSGGKYW